MRDAGSIDADIDVLYDAPTAEAGVGSLLSGDPSNTFGTAANNATALQPGGELVLLQADEAHARPPGSLSSTHAGSAEGLPARVTPSKSPSPGGSGPVPQQKDPREVAQQV